MTTDPHPADVRRALEAVRTGDPAQYARGIGAWNEHAETLAAAFEAAEEKLRRLTPHPIDGPEPQCPTCAGPVHRDMAGTYWTTRSGEHERAETRLQAVRDVVTRWETGNHRPEVTAITMAAAHEIRRALDGER